jgi:hypothetical protein
MPTEPSILGTGKPEETATGDMWSTAQQIYLRALKTIPKLEIIYGHFLEHEVNPRSTSPSYELRKFATFVKPIRKGVLTTSQFPAV